jgi:molybdopterin converting factor small subunit
MQLTLAYGTDRHQIEYADGARVPVVAVLHSLRHLRPDDYAQWCDRSGRIRRSLAVFVNSEHVRYRQGLETELEDGDEVYVVARISGG